MLASIEHPEISAYVREKIKTMQAVAERAKASEKYVIAELDTLVSGADILPAIISQHRGMLYLLISGLHGVVLAGKACLR